MSYVDYISIKARKEKKKKNALGGQVLEAGIKQLDSGLSQPNFSLPDAVYAVYISFVYLLVNLTYLSRVPFDNSSLSQIN